MRLNAKPCFMTPWLLSVCAAVSGRWHCCALVRLEVCNLPWSALATALHCPVPCPHLPLCCRSEMAFARQLLKGDRKERAMLRRADNEKTYGAAVGERLGQRSC